LAGGIAPGHELQPRVDLIEARRGSSFTPFDGNLKALAGRAAPQEGGRISPSALETFATCGLRYFYGYVLRLRAVDKPEESPTMGATDRGTLVHTTLQRFFQEMQDAGRPALGEPWTGEDADRLLTIFEAEFDELRSQGRAGLDIFMNHDRNILR